MFDSDRVLPVLCVVLCGVKPLTGTTGFVHIEEDSK